MPGDGARLPIPQGGRINIDVYREKVIAPRAELVVVATAH
jgi:hypothetical protein